MACLRIKMLLENPSPRLTIVVSVHYIILNNYIRPPNSPTTHSPHRTFDSPALLHATYFLTHTLYFIPTRVQRIQNFRWLERIFVVVGATLAGPSRAGRREQVVALAVDLLVEEHLRQRAASAPV